MNTTYKITVSKGRLWRSDTLVMGDEFFMHDTLRPCPILGLSPFLEPSRCLRVMQVQAMGHAPVPCKLSNTKHVSIPRRYMGDITSALGTPWQYYTHQILKRRGIKSTKTFSVYIFSKIRGQRKRRLHQTLPSIKLDLQFQDNVFRRTNNP